MLTVVNKGFTELTCCVCEGEWNHTILLSSLLDVYVTIRRG